MVDQRTKRRVAQDHMDAIAKRHRENEMEAVAAEAIEELNCHQRQDILDRKIRQYEKTCELSQRVFVEIAGKLTWSVYNDSPSQIARSAWILAEAMIDFANEQRPVE
jgi:hypothetical protein